LNASTVLPDGSVNTLTGGARTDWFLTDVVRDLLKDRTSGERVN
jgi:hypothetical protein